MLEVPVKILEPPTPGQDLQEDGEAGSVDRRVGLFPARPGVFAPGHRSLGM